MNARRVAALLRELADEIERDDARPANDTKARRVHRPEADPDASDLDVEKAAQALRRRGISVR